jgi:hypothetical protein
MDVDVVYRLQTPGRIQSTIGPSLAVGLSVSFYLRQLADVFQGSSVHPN